MTRIDGGSLEWEAGKFMTLATKANVIAMKKSAIYTQGVAKQMIGGVGSGRLYKRGKKSHRASLPGSPPARDTGILANSVSYTVKTKGITVQGHVGSDIDKIRSKDATSDPEYGVFLELGSHKTKARPWLRPALKKSQPTINKIFKKANNIL